MLSEARDKVSNREQTRAFSAPCNSRQFTCGCGEVTWHEEDAIECRVERTFPDSLFRLPALEDHQWTVGNHKCSGPGTIEAVPSKVDQARLDAAWATVRNGP